MTWAVKQHETAQKRTVGIYLGALGFGYNTELARAEKARGAQMLGRPDQAGIQRRGAGRQSEFVGHRLYFRRHAGADHGRGRGVQISQGAAENINQYTKSGAAPAQAAARGETLIGIAFQHDIVTPTITSNAPIKNVSPCEGTGFEIGSMSIIKGAPNLDNAKKWYDWALTPEAQKLARASQFLSEPVQQGGAGSRTGAQDGRHQAHRL